jgi:hypothetical protein
MLHTERDQKNAERGTQREIIDVWETEGHNTVSVTIKDNMHNSQVLMTGERHRDDRDVTGKRHRGDSQGCFTGNVPKEMFHRDASESGKSKK